MVDDKFLGSVRKRLSLASQGPWTAIIEGKDRLSGQTFIQTPEEDVYCYGFTDGYYEFVAHARQDVSILLDEITRLRAALEAKR